MKVGFFIYKHSPSRVFASLIAVKANSPKFPVADFYFIIGGL